MSELQSLTSWQIKTFKQLSLDELYDALKLRIDVFVVEQTCYYPDLDDLDRHPETLHVFSYNQQGEMVAYLRILAKGICYPDYPAIGRVIIAEQARGKGLAHQLIEKSLAVCADLFPQQTIKNILKNLLYYLNILFLFHLILCFPFNSFLFASILRYYILYTLCIYTNRISSRTNHIYIINVSQTVLIHTYTHV